MSTQAFQDTFAGATAGALAGRVSTSGHTWANSTASSGNVPLAIDANATVTVTSSTNDAAVGLVTGFTPPSLATGYGFGCILKTYSTGTLQCGPIVQATDGTGGGNLSGYIASYNESANQIVLWKTTNANPYVSIGTFSHTFSPPETNFLYLHCISDGAGGVNLTVYLNGTSIITANDASTNSPLLTGGIGVRMFYPSGTATTGPHLLYCQTDPQVSTLTGPSSGNVNVASGTFTETLEVPSILGTTATLGVSGVTGTFSPTSLSIAGATATAPGASSATFTMTPSTGGNGSITVTTATPTTTNADSPFAYTVNAPATSYTFTGPSSGAVNAASTNFTVTPNGTYTGTVTITPAGGGLTSPIVLSWTASSAPKTFTITPTSTGTVTLTPTNSGGLTNPAALTYTVTAAVVTWTVLAIIPGFDPNLTNVGYTVYASTGGDPYVARTTSGVVNYGADANGGTAYGAEITLPANSVYVIKWDDGQSPPTYGWQTAAPTTIVVGGVVVSGAFSLGNAVEVLT